MDLQRINVKLFTHAPFDLNLDPFVDIFGRWREDAEDPSQWVDLADYAHVDRGPGVMLIGKRGNLSFDLAAPGPGILYANKSGLDGTPAERVMETFRRHLALVARLIKEQEYPKDLAPRPGSWEIVFNDRVATPNTDAIDSQLKPAVQLALEQLMGTGSTLTREIDPQRRYGFVVDHSAIANLEGLSVPGPSVGV